MKKRVWSLLLSLVLLISVLPTSVLAAEPDNITVTMSVFNQGVPAKDENDKAVLLRTLNISDTDQDGKYSLDEALAQLHTACSMEYSAGEGAWGYSVTKLWGDESGAFGFYKNDVLTTAVNEEYLNGGDRITAFIYKDQANWSDRYSYFDQDSVTVCVNTEFQVVLKYNSWGTISPQATAPIGVFDLFSGAYSVPSALKGEELFEGFYMPTVSTDYTGTAIMSFTKPGEYLLTAQYDSANYTDYYQDPPQYYLVPPLCQVTVLSEEDYAQATLDLAKEELTWDDLSAESASAITTAPALPASLTIGGKAVSISWSCDDPTYAFSVSFYDGIYSAYIDRPAAQDASITLTATLSYNGQSATKVFPVTVKAEGVSADKESVSDYGQLMNSIAEGYTTSTDAWTVLDMAAYGRDIKSDGYGYSASAPTALAEAALGNTPDLSTLSSFDYTGSYAIYTTPYVLLAYDAASADDTAFATKRSDLKAAMVAYLNALDSNYADTDEVTPILAALAPYCGEGDAALDDAVFSAINWLSIRQSQDGTFGYYGTANANSTALAVVALSALGIDAHTDTRFVKEQSAVDGLFSFALSSLDGFGYKGNVTRNTLATEQGFRTLVSYARFAEQNAAYNIYLDADLNADAPAVPQISTTAPTPPQNPDGGREDDTITISFAMTVNNKSWIPAHDVELEEGSTVADAFHQVLDGREGFSYVAEENYVRSVTYNGETAGEFTSGQNSGWKYKINGEAPGVGMADRVLEDEDALVWYYVVDYTKDPTPDEDSVRITAKDRAAAKAVKNLISAIGTVTESSGDEIEAARKAYDALTDEQKELVSNYETLLAAEAEYAELMIILPFTDVAEDYWAAEEIRWAYANGYISGKTETTFDPASSISRQQIWMILARYAGKDPADMAKAKAWAFANGISDGTNPGNAVTRQQLVALLYRYAAANGYDVSKKADLSVYPDVAAVAGYACDAMAWSVANGIVGGTATGTLDPTGNATRAQFAAILYRFCEKMN